MVHLALALASVLVLPSLSTLGAQAAPVLPPAALSQQYEMHGPKDHVTADLDDMVKRPMAFYHERKVVQATPNFEETDRPKPAFIRRRSTGRPPFSAHRAPAAARFASGEGRRKANIYGGMYASGGSKRVNADVNTKRTSTSPPAAGVPGKVSVVSAGNSSNGMVDLATNAQPLASLVFSLDSNATSGAIKATASANNYTTLYLTPASPNTTTNAALADPSDLLVNLKMAVFDPDHAALVQYCASYISSPSNTSSITALPCGTVAEPHSSQVFIYTPASGAVHPLWTQDVAAASNAAASNASLLAESSAASAMGSKVMNATSTLITCHPDSHNVVNSLLADSPDTNATDTTSTDSPAMFELVFIPDSAAFLVAPPTTTYNVTEALREHIDVVDTHSEPAPPTFTGLGKPSTTPVSSPVNSGAVHLAEALLPMIPFPDPASGASTPAPSPSDRK